MNGNYTEDYPSLHEKLRIDSIKYFKIIPAISVLNNSVESEKSWLDSTFNNADALMCQAVLHTITNKILLSETLMLDYFDRRTSILDCGNYDRFSAIITLNGTYIKSGDSIQVTSGVGTTSLTSHPTFFIDGKRIEPTIEGVAVYSFKPKVKPGKYTVPVRIEYYRPDGVKDTVSKNLSYTVVD